MQKTIKVFKNGKISVNGKIYLPYTISSLPPSFGCIDREDMVTSGVSEWFNVGGLTYLIER
jgi:hypothetical protein